MLPQNAKVGLRVRINSNIKRTKERLSADSTMNRMAGDRKLYPIEEVIKKESIVSDYTLVRIAGYAWMVEDVIWDDEPGPEDISLQGQEVTFDPSELHAGI